MEEDGQIRESHKLPLGRDESCMQVAWLGGKYIGTLAFRDRDRGRPNRSN